MKAFIALTFITALSSCGSVKEVSAPCKRPPTTTAFVEDPRHDCGPMHSINGDGSAAVAAFHALLTVRN